MKLKLKLKLDENLGNRTLTILQDAGYDVTTVAQQHISGILDCDLIDLCSSESRALVSFDLDFANPLRFRRRAGISGCIDSRLRRRTVRKGSAFPGDGSSNLREATPRAGGIASNKSRRERKGIAFPHCAAAKPQETMRGPSRDDEGEKGMRRPSRKTNY